MTFYLSTTHVNKSLLELQLLSTGSKYWVKVEETFTSLSLSDN